MKAVVTLTAAVALTSFALGCSVGTYNIPDVAPVVMPEPEEDLFADLEMDSDDSSSSDSAPEAPSEPATEGSEAPPAPEAVEEKPAPAEKKKK